jgi:hypothetical protein
VQTYHVGLLGLAFFLVLGLVAFWSWVTKMRAQEKSIVAPEFLNGPASGQKAFYVATTFSGRPLERVLAHGLAHRGNATVLVSKRGLSIFRTGEPSFLVPAENLLSFAKNSTVIDRAVEKDGLISIRWNLGGTEIETHLRFVGASARDTIVSELNVLVGA